MLATPLSSGDFVWLVGSLCKLNRLPFDAALLLQRFPAPHHGRSLVEAAEALGFRTGTLPSTHRNLRRLRCPCIGILKGGRPALVLEADAERALYCEAGGAETRSAPPGELARQLEPDLLVMRHEPAAGDDRGVDSLAAERSFGFRWFWTELLRHRRVWREVLAASFFLQLIALATPLGTQVILDKVVVHHTGSTLAVIAAGLALFLVFGAGMTWLRQYLILHTGNRVDAVLGSEVFRHLLRLDLAYFAHRPTGTLVARIQAVETIREFMAGAAVALLLDLPFLFVFLAVMFWYSWQLSLIALGLLGTVAALSIAVTPALRARLNRQFLLGARNQAFLTEYVSGVETVKALQMEPRLESRYDGYLAAYLAAGFRTRQLSNSYNVAANALEQAMSLAVLCAGALLVMRADGFTIGMLVAFQMFASRLSQPMLRLAGLWQEFQQASIAVRRLGDIMDAPAEPHAAAPSRASEGRGRIVVRDLSFRYSPRHAYLFRHLDLALKPGKLTVLTGPSGCGKSTLARLLLGMYQPEDGQILLDGRDLRHLAANELRRSFGVVPQETRLFSGTVYENLLAASPQADFEEVVRASRLAEIHEVIERLPQGYQTEIGEHGAGLSGGQKQRLAIARAILKGAPVLVFDEATSSLDAHTAEQFARTVNQLRGQATILFIAHQVPAGLQVDETVVLAGERRVLASVRPGP